MIYHLIGTRMCGKSFLSRNILKEKNILIIDIFKDFYLPLEIIVEDKFIFKNYYKYIDYLPIFLRLEILRNKGKNMIIESSGTNKSVNKELKAHQHKVIALKTPTNKILEERAKLDNLDPLKILEFKTFYENQLRSHIENLGIKEFNGEEAFLFFSKRI